MECGEGASRHTNHMSLVSIGRPGDGEVVMVILYGMPTSTCSFFYRQCLLHLLQNSSKISPHCLVNRNEPAMVQNEVIGFSWYCGPVTDVLAAVEGQNSYVRLLVTTQGLQ